MVLLTKIYTRGGDQGQTSLGSGERLSKFSDRVQAMGDVDETNATLGLVRLHLEQKDEIDIISRIQNDLFDVGADLCMPQDHEKKTTLRILPRHVLRLEQEIDQMNQNLEPLNSFILPGGTSASAYLHLARTITRRAERTVCHLAAQEDVNIHLISYLNRLSDHLFVFARHANDQGRLDILWDPGANIFHDQNF
ncbi:MAG: cob(I)yrinic acid a,c-diamide adenosyltransferase [Janthinobacterium lividum]